MQETFKAENFRVPHTWFFGFYKNGVQRADTYEELQEVDTRNFRAIFRFSMEQLTTMEEPKITTNRVDNN